MNEPAAVDYLPSNYPKWSEVYHLYSNHWTAMTVVARDLSNDYGLTIYAAHLDWGWMYRSWDGVYGNFDGKESSNP